MYLPFQLINKMFYLSQSIEDQFSINILQFYTLENAIYNSINLKFLFVFQMYTTNNTVQSKNVH